MLLRWTPLLFLVPGRFVQTDAFWRTVVLDQLDHEWTRDGWRGLKDTVSDPYTTLLDGRGDCEDYAVLAASARRASGAAVALAFCWQDRPWPTHVVASDGDRVYSSGRIHEQSLEDWLADSRYRFAAVRPVSKA
jgi:hypothetical protein